MVPNMLPLDGGLVVKVFDLVPPYRRATVSGKTGLQEHLVPPTPRAAQEQEKEDVQNPNKDSSIPQLYNNVARQQGSW